MPSERRELLLPELGMGQAPIVASQWLVEQGDSVLEGDRLLEVLAGSATIDLPSPASGKLTEVLVGEDEPLTVGQLLAVVMAETDDDRASG